jgi:hypothetical protein
MLGIPKKELRHDKHIPGRQVSENPMKKGIGKKTRNCDECRQNAGLALDKPPEAKPLYTMNA